MPSLLLHLPDICRFSAALLISATVEASLLTLALALALRLFPRIPAMLRFSLWIAVLVASVTLPFLPFLRHSSAAAAPQTLLHADVRWSFAIAGLWALMSIVRAAQLACGMVRLRAIAQRSVPVESVPLTALDGSRPALLCTSDDVQQPSVIGFLTPRILVPTGLYPRLSVAELEQIVLHEREHLRRRDDWINLLQKIVLVLFPLNPVLFWVERRLCLERELACDDSVLEATRTPRSYATCLVRLAEDRIFGGQLPLALGAWGRKSELTRRVHHILEPTRKRLTRSQAALAVALIGSGLAAGAALVAHTPQLVSFQASPATPAMQMLAAIHAPLPPATAFHDVNMTATAAPHATLVKAVMPAPARTARHRNRPRAAQQWMLTTWTYRIQNVATPVSSETPGLPRFAVIQTRQQVPSYAAIATANGWLIIQL
ncbi:MAG TPA: M56 family metallopeptidase [Acidobacteriaceae bacterium]|nr:M56 family metallopeptidase [Acidobacteriaceae bacterium]